MKSTLLLRLFLVVLLCSSLRATVTITFDPNASYNAQTGLFTNNIYTLSWSKTENYQNGANNSATRNEVRVANTDGTWNPSGGMIHSDSYGQPASGTKTGNFEYVNRRFGIREYTQVTTNGVMVETYQYRMIEFGAPPAPKEQLAWDIPKNTGANAMNWGVFKVSDGSLVASVNVPAGAEAGFLTVDDLPAGTLPGEYVLRWWMPGIGFNAGSGQWISTTTTAMGQKPATGAETVFDANTGTPSTAATHVTTGTAPSVLNSIGVTAPSILPGAVAAPTGTGGSVWVSAPSGGGLNDTTYREGVNKLFDVVNRGGVVGDATVAAKGAGESATSGMGSAGGTAKTAVQAAMPGVPSAATMGGDGTAPAMGLVLGQSMGGYTFDVNPFSSNRFDTLASWFRAAVTWATLLLFGKWVWEQMGGWIRGFSLSPQAKGNPVVAGTGAQATALVAAGLITTAVIGGVTAIVGFAFGEITIPAVTSAVGSNPFAAMPAGSLYLLNKWFPLGIICTALLARVTFNLYASTIFGGVSTLIRFVVP